MAVSFGNINAAIRHRLLSKEKKIQKEKTLFEKVQDGDIVEHFKKSPAWLKIVNPWLKAERENAQERLDGVAHEFPGDTVGFGERGKRRLVKEFWSMLDETLENREAARQKLSELQLTGEKDD